MNLSVVAILILGGICLALITWLYRQKIYYENLLHLRDKGINALVGINEMEMKRLADELEKYKAKEGE